MERLREVGSEKEIMRDEPALAGVELGVLCFSVLNCSGLFAGRPTYCCSCIGCLNNGADTKKYLNPCFLSYKGLDSKEIKKPSR